MKAPFSAGQASRLFQFSNQPLKRKLAFKILETGATPVLLWLAVLLSSLSFQFATAHAQTYSIDWYKFSGGGGASTGGVYSASGTVGQHDASEPVTGGIYSATSGFWALYAVQVPGVPPLNIFLTVTNTAVIAWPSWPTNFVLRQNASLGTTNWLAVTNAPVEVNGTNQIVVQPFTGSRFYRLKQPAAP